MVHLHKEIWLPGTAEKTVKGETEYSEEERRDLTDAFPSVFRIHGQHGNIASTKHLLMHVKLTYNGSDTLLLHHGLREMHTHNKKYMLSGYDCPLGWPLTA